MRITPFFFWQILLAITIGTFFCFPQYHILFWLIIIIHILIFAAGIKYISLQFFGRAFWKGNKASQTIALTFDDGPDPAITPDILDLLKKHSMKATFFIVGIKARKNQDIVSRAYNEGHTIACHDLTHSILSNFRITKPLIRDIAKAQGYTKSIIGKSPLLYRPPVGLMNPHVPKALMSLGIHCIGWNKSASEAGNRRLINIKKIHSLASPGAVILLHDIVPKKDYKLEILNQIEQLLINIKKQNLTTVPIGEMFNLKLYS